MGGVARNWRDIPKSSQSKKNSSKNQLSEPVESSLSIFNSLLPDVSWLPAEWGI